MVEPAQSIAPDPLTTAAVTAIVFLLAVRCCDIWEREPVWLLLALALWGATGAVAVASPLNDFMLDALPYEISVVWGPALSAPVVEELAKGLALAVVFLVTRGLGERAGRARFDGVVDGVVYGAAIGIGFAFAENNIYFLAEETTVGGVETLGLREGFLGLGTLGHAVYTAALGAGLGLATQVTGGGRKLGAVAIGLIAAITAHAVHNGLVPLALVREYGLDASARALSGQPLAFDLAERMQATVRSGENLLEVMDYVLLVAIAVAFVLGLRAERNALRRELVGEVDRGLLTSRERDLVASFTRRPLLYLRLALGGELDELVAVRREHRAIAELAFAKARQQGVQADEIERLRARVAQLPTRSHRAT